MGKNTLIGLAAVALIIILVYLLFPGKSAPTQPQPVSVPTTYEEQQKVTVNLGAQEGSSERGTATLEEVSGQVVVTLNLSGAPEGVSQPAHIHAGSCPDVGDVVYPLEFPLNGDSQTTLDTTLAELRAQMPMAINVHKSVAEAKVYVSCGNLPL